MKITDVRTYLVANVPPYHGGRSWLFVKLYSDEGIEGIGEWSTAHVGRERAQAELVEALAREYAIGANPFDIELLWQRMYATDHDYRHPGLFITPALSAIEMACWDIVGKALKQPVYNLLGGRYHEKLRAYAYMPTQGIWETPEKAGEIAARLVKEGNTACKFDPFVPFFPLPRDIPLRDIKRVARIFRCIRDAVGDALEVGLGTHGQLTTASAIRVARALEAYDPFWFEEPVPPENVDEMARVAAHTSIPRRTPASPSPPASDCSPSGSLSRSCTSRRRRSSSLTSDIAGGSWNPKRSPAWPRRTMRRSPPTCTAAPWPPRRRSSSRPARPTF